MICCVTGHRPNGFQFLRDEKDERYLKYLDRLRREVEGLIEEGYECFITGMADGADVDFASMVLSLREDGKAITLEAALPFPLRSCKRQNAYHQKRDWILQECDRSHVVSPYYHKGCMQKRNCYMVDRSHLILAIWNGCEKGGTWNTIQYAKSKGKEIRYIMLTDDLIPLVEDKQD